MAEEGGGRRRSEGGGEFRGGRVAIIAVTTT